MSGFFYSFCAFRFCSEKSHFVFAKLRFWFCRDYMSKEGGVCPIILYMFRFV